MTLLEQVKQGDGAGWQRLISLYRPLVLWWCRNAVARPDDADDVVQEVFQTVAAKMTGFVKPDQGGGFRAWLRAITRHKLGDYLRRVRQEPIGAGGSQAQDLLGEVPAEATPDSSAYEEPLERRILIRRALELIRADVEPRTWEAAWKTLVDDRRPAEVAAELGMTANAVYIARSRLLSRLRQELSDLLE